MSNSFNPSRTESGSRILDRISEIATRGMLFEVAVTPKPGMVDRAGTGVHQDMDYFTFMQSSAVLAQAFRALTQAGYDWPMERPLAQLLPELRQLGGDYEARMLTATGGVNTHRGLLFLLGTLTAVAGYLQRQTGMCSSGDFPDLLKNVGDGLVERELKQARSPVLTAGQRAFKEAGLTGIRGEMAAGLPALFNHGLPALQQALAQGGTYDQAGVDALMAIIHTTEDTVIWKRGGMPALTRARRLAGEVLAGGGCRGEVGSRRLQEMGDLFVRQGLSAGGGADILAATFAVYFWHQEI